MKKLIYSLVFVLATISFVACDDINYKHDKYLAQGEDLLIGKLDSFKIYGGKQRAKIVVWAGDFRAQYLVISRADSTLKYKYTLNPTNRKDSMVFYINSLREGTNVLSWKTWNSDSTVHSIQGGTTVSTWGSKYESFLLTRKITSAKVNLLTKAYTLTWETNNVVEPVFGKASIGHEIKYTTKFGNDTTLIDSYQIAVSSISILKNYPTTGGSFKYRMMYLPDKACIDTFRTAYTTYQ
jgi:hypothetical protein